MPDQYPAPDMSEVELVDLLRAMGDPVRMTILGVLADGEPRPKTQDVWGLPLEKSTLSHHFRVLREAGLTRTVVSGRNHTIQLRRSELDAQFPGLLDAVLPPLAGHESSTE